MRIIGLDYGSKTVGVAISDPTGFLATPVETIKREEEVNLKQTVRRIRALCEEYDVHTVVLGLPKNMNDTLGERAELTMEFQKRLQRDLYLVEVVLWDERLTTRQAEIPMLEAGMRYQKRKQVVDQMAAALILQSYLDAHQKQVKEKSRMSQICLEELDWIIVTDPVEEISMDMEVIDFTEIEGVQYLLAIPAYEEEDEEEAEQQEDNDAAFIFKVCEDEVAEFWITEDHSDLKFGVTTDMDDEEFQSIAEVFESSEEYDLEVEDEDEHN